MWPGGRDGFVASDERRATSGEESPRAAAACMLLMWLFAGGAAGGELGSISFTDIDIGNLSSGVTTYSTKVWNEVSVTTVTAEAASASSSVSISPTDADTGTDGHQVNLAEGANAITVMVVAADMTETTYTFNLTRRSEASNLPAGRGELRLHGATQSSLVAPQQVTRAGPLRPPYQGTLALYQDGTWKAVCDDYWGAEEAAVACSQIGLVSSAATGFSNLATGVTTYGMDNVVCTGDESHLFDCDALLEDILCFEGEAAGVHCLPPPPGNAMLASLHLTDVAIDPFSASVQTYSGTALMPTSRTTVWARTTHAGATVDITPADADENTDGHQVDLDGLQTIEVEVTAEDGTTRTYTVNVTLRAVGTNARLSGLSLGGDALGSFSPGQTSYRVNLGRTERRSLLVAATAEDSNATVAIGAGSGESGGSDVNVQLFVGHNEVKVTVTAEDGVTTRTYTVILVVEALAGDSSLLWLRLDGVGVPGFSPETTAYSTTVGNGTTTVRVTARADDSRARVAIGGGGWTDQEAAHTMLLELGQNSVNISVLATGGSIRRYTLTVTREFSDTDARLSSLTFSGIAFGPFSPDILTYSAKAPAHLLTTTVSARTAHPDALVSIVDGLAGGPVNSEDVALDEGVTVVAIEVRAADATTRRTYTVRVTRAAGLVADFVTVDGSRLVLAYGENLDATSVPEPEDFSVRVDGAQVAVSLVSVVAETVVLELASAPAHAALVTVDYVPGADPVQGESGTGAIGLSGAVAAETLISVSGTSTTEGESARFPVRLSKAVDDVVAVNWSLLPGTALAADDYTSQSGVLEIGAGATGEIISVSTTEDDVSEPAETFTVQLSEPPNFPHWARLTVSEAVGTIKDDDSPGSGAGGSGGSGGSGGGSGGSGGAGASDDDDEPPGPDDGEGGDGTSDPPSAAIHANFDCGAGLCRVRTGEVVAFTDGSSGAVRFRSWNFGDGRSGRGSSVRHSWSVPGFYTVTLTVSDGRNESIASLVFLVTASAPAGNCEPDAETLCLQDSLFAVKAEWERDGEPVAARVVHAGTNDSGLFQFLGADNWEVLIKVLDGCAVNGHFWVFGASATDLGYSIRVSDTTTGEGREYGHERGSPATSITDVNAFALSCRP